MIRIYLRNIQDILCSDKKSRAFLYYLQLRESQKVACGGFNIKTMVEVLGMSDKSCRRALNDLIHYGYVIQNSKTHYRIVSQRKIVGSNLHEQFYKITKEELFSYSWRNISYFRATLMELFKQKKVNARKYIHKIVFETGRHGEKTRRDKASDTLLMSSTFIAKAISRTSKTITTYNKKQKLVSYSKKEIIRVVDKKTHEKTVNYGVFGGKFFVFKGSLLFIPTLNRLTDLKLCSF